MSLVRRARRSTLRVCVSVRNDSSCRLPPLSPHKIANFSIFIVFLRVSAAISSNTQFSRDFDKKEINLLKYSVILTVVGLHAKCRFVRSAKNEN